MMTFTELTSVPSDPGVPLTDQLRLAVAAYLARFGAQDPSFVTGDEQLASALHVHLHTWPGVHDLGYWNAHWKAYLGFYAHALATCK